MHAMEVVNHGPVRPGVHVQVDAATQADLVGYESEDERMGRRATVPKRSTPTPYSKVDIREQYCINRKQVQVLESNGTNVLFGCLSKYHDSSCNKHSLLRCMDRAPSDENLQDSTRQSLPRRPIDDLERAYMRRRPKSMCGTDPRKYAWIPEDEESCRMENARSVAPDTELLLHSYDHTMSLSSEHLATACPAHYLPPPPPPPASAVRTKHVSFARSHTLTSFDDAIMELRRAPTPVFKSQERLILSTQPGRRTGPPVYQTYEQRVTKKPPMKTQATQTGLVGREPPNYLSLSPRTVHRGAQTNGQVWNGRKLMKSYSAAGCQFGNEQLECERNKEHEALTRTQSEEPRSPYMKTVNLPWPSEASPRTEQQKRGRPSKVYKEILIDFEPADGRKRSRLGYANHSDGEFVSDGEMEPVVDRVDGVKVSLSSFSSFQEDDGSHSEPAQHPGLLRTHDSVDEEFHENLVYEEIFKKQHTSDVQEVPRVPQSEVVISASSSPEQRSGIITVNTMNNLTVSRRASPFASSDSLTTDQRADHSDGIWNESQSTVLQAESDNGTFGGSSSKKHLLLLHQQRSSIDTEALDDDFLHSQTSLFSPLKETTVPSVTIATVHQDSTSPTSNKGSPNLPRAHGPIITLSPIKRELRKKFVKSPDKEEVVVRRDSGRITDISETSTTDDYATALDNSEASCRQQQGSKQDSKEGSSFESASSLPSFAKEEAPVKSVSPPSIQKEGASLGGNAEKKSDEIEEIASLESSSSGSYSLDSCQKEGKEKEWTDQEKSHMKKGFKLELSDHSGDPEVEEDRAESGKHDEQCSPKRVKSKASSSRKMQQGPAKKWSSKAAEDIAPGMVRSPAMPEGFHSEGWAPPQRSTPHTPEEGLPSKNGVALSSDESSCEYKNTGIDETINGHSPRRQRKRGGPRGRRGQDTSGRSRRPLIPPQPSSQPQQLSPSNYCRSPNHSPRGSPRKTNKGTKENEQKKVEGTADEGGHLKAVSAESLRSVSPGSDSVFYNEGDTHLLCHQCGRGVEPQPGQSKKETDIVQPPPRFADSPDGLRGKAHRLFKKQEKRFRSEERTGERRRPHRTRKEGMRAKSEERGKDKKPKDKLRPHAHSTDASLELLRGADSSPSISDPFTDQDQRVYADAFKKSSWFSIVEEAQKVLLPDDSGKRARAETREDSSYELTPTEKDFRKKFQAATHRLVHRKSSMDMYQRLQDNTFECDKKIVVKRESGEFGFRIHGSRPVVVSAIEPDTPAETSGLEIGDIVLTVNGISVLEASHTDVVKLAHSGSDTLELELARTSAAIMPISKEDQETVQSGFLCKLGMDGAWHQRWFVLKKDNCLYYYNSKAESQPLGALLLINYTVTLLPDTERAHSFIIAKHGAKSMELSAESSEDRERWKETVENAASAETTRQGKWFDKSCLLLQQPAAAVAQPDCFGHLTQLEDKWRRRYCVLKDAALLLYADSAAQRALGVACLQGYRVQSSGTCVKRYSFEVVPPESKQKHFYFYTDTEMDKKRWIAAIEYSIDRWMKIG